MKEHVHVVLVTGGTGMLGQALARHVHTLGLNDVKWVFVGSDVDLRQPDACFRLFDNVRPTHVIHLAAKVGGLFENRKNNMQFFFDNVSMAYNVMEACKAYQVQRVLNCLSVCVFPAHLSSFVEEDILSGPPHESNWGYAWAKRMLYVMSQEANRERGYVWASCFSPCNMYGRGDKSSHVIPDLIRAFNKASLDGASSVVCKGTGQSERDFICVDDVAKVIARMTLAEDVPAHLIISPGTRTRIGDLVRLLSCHYQIPYHFEGNPQDDGHSTRCGCPDQLISFYPNWNPKPLQDGLLTILE